MKTNVSNRLALFVASGLLLWAACDQSTTTAPPAGPDGILALVLPGIPDDGDGSVDPEEFELCKTGSAATFDYTVAVVGGAATTGTVSLFDGECRVLAEFGGAGALVTVTEQVPVNFDLANVALTTATFVDCTGSPTTSTSSPTNQVGPVEISGSGGTNGLCHGVLAIYTNVPEPPEEGGEGCTPGFWKNWTGLGSQPNVWPNPPYITDLFSDHFDDAFPGMTLLQVVGQGGGGLNALGRHTVAALLNAASPNVSYDISDVVAQFNGVFPGTKDEYNTLKGTFAGFNEQETPGFCE